MVGKGIFDSCISINTHIIRPLYNAYISFIYPGLFIRLVGNAKIWNTQAGLLAKDQDEETMAYLRSVIAEAGANTVAVSFLAMAGNEELR